MSSPDPTPAPESQDASQPAQEQATSEAAPEAVDPNAALLAAVTQLLESHGFSSVTAEALPAANDGDALRLALKGPAKQREAVLEAASLIFASDAGDHHWQFIAGGAPDPTLPADKQTQSAVLRALD